MAIAPDTMTCAHSAVVSLRRFFHRLGNTVLILALTLGTGLNAHAQPAPPQGYGATDHLVLAAPLPVQSPADTVEVVTLFWYGCPHCNQLEPLLKAWAARLPQGVTLRRIPAVLAAQWEPGARLYYTLQALGQIERLHQAVFDAEHLERSIQVVSRDPEQYADWATQHGIDRARFIATWNSATVSAQVDEATRLTLPYRRIAASASRP